MIYAVLALWIFLAAIIIPERRGIRIIIYFAIFSLVTALSFFLLGSPDVAMAEAAISTFSTIFFVICFEKHFRLKADNKGEPEKKTKSKAAAAKKYLLPLILVVPLFALFIIFRPGPEVSTYLRDLYITRFAHDVGGFNAVTSIYLAYRVYDTLFEALILVIAIVAVSHMSAFKEITVPDGEHSDIERDGLAVFTIRIIAPILLVFGVYLVMNGHISPGGGFQGGVAVAAFFICRYMIFNIYDIPVKKIIRIEEILFMTAVAIAVFGVFLGAGTFVPLEYLHLYQEVYLILMNILIGLKVACACIVLFYRFVAIERR